MKMQRIVDEAYWSAARRFVILLFFVVGCLITVSAHADREPCDPRHPKCPRYRVCKVLLDGAGTCIAGCDPRYPDCPPAAPHCLPWPRADSEHFRCYAPPPEVTR